MINVTIYRDGKRRYKGFRVCGHAGSGEYGHDIVCAAASVVAQNTVNSIESLTGDDFVISLDEDKGLLEIKFTGKISAETDILMKSFEIGMKSIMENYEDYIDMKYKEV